jgi:hypothetical protein
LKHKNNPIKKNSAHKQFWKKINLIAVILLIPTTAKATYFANPALPALESDGLIKSPPSWVCFRIGYMSDNLYRQRYNEEFEIDGSTTPSSYAKLATNAATITLNYKNWLDLNALVGSAKMQIDHDVYTKQQLAWGIGAKFLIFQTDSIFVGLDLKYFQSDQKPLFLTSSGLAYNVVTNFKLNYTEEQAALGIAYRNQMISPYAYASYLYSKISPNPITVLVRMPFYDGYAQSISSSVINKRRWGMAFGATIVGGCKGSVTIESRFFNQNAINVSGDLRF